MKRPRLSILGMMAAIVVIALGFAALRNPTVLTASLIFTATVTYLATGYSLWSSRVGEVVPRA